jgi:hypothetical protein
MLILAQQFKEHCFLAQRSRPTMISISVFHTMEAIESPKPFWPIFGMPLKSFFDG